MPTLKDVIVELCRKKNWNYKKEDDEILFVVKFPDGRTQTCLSKVGDCQKGNCVHIISPVGKVSDFSQERMIELLQYNQKLIYARVQIDKEKSYIEVSGKTLIETSNVDEVEMIVEEVAKTADILEKKYFIHDEM